ncbi:MAG: hypothetical protein ABRQ25_14660 [Clostridiaceae bacterium]
MAKNFSKKSMNINELSFEDDFDESGFTDAVVGTPLSTFSFSNDSPPSSVKEVHLQAPSPVDRDLLIDCRRGKTAANGITPPIDGENFDIRRSFKFRKSTVRKLNELKANHPDVNAYLSTIIDAAINHYYAHIINSQSCKK